MAYTTIDKPDEYFNTVTYTGNGTLATAITGVGFQPDLTWIKNRSAGEEQMWYDAVRGASKLLRCNGTDPEATTSTTVYFNSFDSDGFTIGTETALNANGQNIVAWNWLGANSTASNTAGSITSTVSASTTSGFSIVSYTGNATVSQTVGHGLGVAPAMIIVKNRSASPTSWRVYHKSLGVNGSNPNFLELDSNSASQTGDTGNFASVPTSSVFGVGNYNVVNGSGNGMVAYCFAEKKGFSKFGSFVSNNTSDNAFIYTGFKPAFLIAKSTTSTNNWVMFDNKRNTFNAVDKKLYPDLSNSEDTEADWDFLSNGLKLRAIAGANTFIYMAFAENPFVTSTSIPTTAR